MSPNFMNLAKEARDNKDFYLEKKYLEEAYKLNPNNTKIINALVRNAKKINHPYELEKWLDILYSIKPSGEVLFQLIQLARSEGNKVREEELLMKKRELEPSNHKVNKTLSSKGNGKRKEIIRDPLPYINLSEEEYKLVTEVRKVIYGDFELKYKVATIRELLDGKNEIMFCLMVELYKSELFLKFAKDLIKDYKKDITEETPITKKRLANKMLQFAVSRKTMRGDWDLFWFGCKRDTLMLIKK